MSERKVLNGEVVHVMKGVSEFVSNYDFDPKNPHQRKVLQDMMKLAEKKIDKEEAIIKVKASADRKLLNIIIWSILFSITIALVLNTVNHFKSVNLEQRQVELKQQVNKN